MSEEAEYAGFLPAKRGDQSKARVKCLVALFKSTRFTKLTNRKCTGDEPGASCRMHKSSHALFFRLIGCHTEQKGRLWREMKEKNPRLFLWLKNSMPIDAYETPSCDKSTERSKG